jgi:hypothetical protein
MAAPTPASDESPGADYRGRHRTAEDRAEPVAAVVVTGSDVRIEPLDGLIRAHGFTGRAGTVQI